MLTQERLKELFNYNPETGLFTRILNVANVHAGDVAGWIRDNGYIDISVDNKKWRAHILAWFFTYGEIPKLDIDHINGNRIDNRISNLRLANRSQNNENRKCAQSNNKTGLMGVCAKRKKWRATIVINGKQTNLGVFDTQEDAHQAYLNAKRKHHTFCTI